MVAMKNVVMAGMAQAVRSATILQMLRFSLMYAAETSHIKNTLQQSLEACGLQINDYSPA